MPCLQPKKLSGNFELGIASVGARQSVADGHPGTIGALDQQDITRSNLRLHGIGGRSDSPPGNGAAYHAQKFPASHLPEVQNANAIQARQNGRA
jgi:hypothetical protein